MSTRFQDHLPQSTCPIVTRLMLHSFQERERREGLVRRMARVIYFHQTKPSTPDESKSWRKGTLTAASLEASFSIVSLIVRVTSLASELGFGFDNWMLWFVLKSPTYMHHGIASRIALSSKILVFDAALTPAMRTPPGANPRNVETCHVAAACLRASFLLLGFQEKSGPSFGQPQLFQFSS